MAAREIKAGGAFVEMSLRDKTEQGLKRVQQRLSSVGATLIKAGAPIAAALGGAVAKFVSVGDALDKMSSRTGISVEDLSTLGYAAEQSGASLEDLERAFRRSGQNIEQFKDTADEIAAIQDPTQRAAAAMKIFGRAGAQLVPLLSGGRAGIERLQQSARDLGKQLTGQDAKAAAALGDAWDNVKQVMTSAAVNIGATLAPALTAIAEKTVEIVQIVVGWIKENKELVLTLAKVSAGLVIGGGVMVVLAKVIGGVTAAVRGLGIALTFISTHPVVAVLTLLAAVLGTVAYKFYSAKSAVNSFADELKRVQKEAQKELQATIALQDQQRAQQVAAKLPQQSPTALGSFNPFVIGRITGHVGPSGDAGTHQRLDRAIDLLARIERNKVLFQP